MTPLKRNKKPEGSSLRSFGIRHIGHLIELRRKGFLIGCTAIGTESRRHDAKTMLTVLYVIFYRTLRMVLYEL